MPEPLLLATWSFGEIAGKVGWPVLDEGSAALDAVEVGAAAVEADPKVHTVGYGAWPDRRGEVSLDAAIMSRPDRAGAVCYVRRFYPAVSIARAVMERTQHVLLAGEGAEQFAMSQGYDPTNLVSDEAKAKWERWRTDNPRAAGDDTVPYRPAVNIEEAAPDDTVGVLALDRSGELAGACSTSGMSFKVPGRVGDSPIIGHGLYVDPEAGAAVCTGTGELAMGTCAAFLACERMRAGGSPGESAMAALQRVQQTHELAADHQLAIITLRPDGAWSSAALRSGFSVAKRDGAGAERVEPETMLLNSP